MSSSAESDPLLVERMPESTAPHRPHVAVDRVDLAVVAEVAERLSALPRGARVRREALVEDRERHLERAIAEVGVELPELVGRAEGLVRQRAEGHRDDVRAGDPSGTAACAVGAKLGGVRVQSERPQEHELLDGRHRPASRLAQRLRHDGDAPPARSLDSLPRAGLLDSGARALVTEEHLGEPAPRPRHERCRNRQEDAGAVARAVVGGDRPTVPDVRKPFERGVENLTRGAAARVGDEADATGVALEALLALLLHEHPLGVGEDGTREPPGDEAT